MKNLLLTAFLLLTTLLNAQKINLSNKEELIKFLNKKEVTVGQYGKMVLSYDSYDKAFNALKFKVEFTPTSSEKKPKKIQLETMVFEADGFYIQDYVRNFDLKTPGAFVNDKYDFPTSFTFFENGEIYFRDQPTLSMEEYIKAIVNSTFISSAKYVLCK
jgi:hypothetical protein